MLLNNKKAMEILADFDSEASQYGGQPRQSGAESLSTLKDAIAILETSKHRDSPEYKRLLALTLNNTACYYKR